MQPMMNSGALLRPHLVYGLFLAAFIRACRDRGRHHYLSQLMPGIISRVVHFPMLAAFPSATLLPIGVFERRTRREQVRRSAYRCVAVAVRNRQNQLRPSSPLRPVATRRVLYLTHELWELFSRLVEIV